MAFPPKLDLALAALLVRTGDDLAAATGAGAVEVAVGAAVTGVLRERMVGTGTETAAGGAFGVGLAALDAHE